ncbi:MAG: hypothetical protein HQK49_22405 [Oligoflexia bacterium]|nr:hypothetical protein [Oligoflexia bacterium]
MQIIQFFLIRGEHGGFISYFIGKNYIWEYNWYENPIFKELHEIEDGDEVLSYLKTKNIKYVISMDKSELVRFYQNAFRKTNPLFKETLVKMIIEDDKRLVLLNEEKKEKGLELKLYYARGL